MSPDTQPSRLALVSGHQFGLRALRGLIDAPQYDEGHIRVEAVLGLHPRHALDTAGFADLVAFAAASGLRCAYFNSAKSPQMHAYLAKVPHDFLLVIGLSQLIPQATLDLPAHFNGATMRNGASYGCIGMHPTLLPVGRGRAPIPWTILRKLRRSGVTAFFLEEEPDEGAIIDNEDVSLADDETSASVFEKMAEAHTRLSRRLARTLSDRAVRSTPQDPKAASTWPKRRMKDGWINFASSASEIDRLVRAVARPYPGAFFVYKDAVIHVESVEPSSVTSTDRPGTIATVDESGVPVVVCGEGVVRLSSFRTTARIRFEEKTQIFTIGVECLDD